MNKILAPLAILTLIAGGLWLSLDSGRVPIFDADLNRLAETPREAWCAGNTFWDGRKADPAKAKACRQAQTHRSDSVNHSLVLRNFCDGAKAAGFPGHIQFDCVDVFTERQMWPTRDGGITMAFNSRYPWPGETFQSQRTDQQPSHRGTEREGFSR
jgi:hypothetical protein